MTRQEASRLVAVLSAAYPNTKVGKETIGVYVKMLTELESGPCGDAVAECLRTCKWFPSIAEIRVHYADVVSLRKLNRLALDEPEVTEDQWQENRDRARALRKRLGRSLRSVT